MRQKSKATIYDISLRKEGVPVFYKQCPQCHFCYRYAEYKDGLHMADNTTILTFQLCLLLRASIKYHTAIGRECLILEDAFPTKYPANIFQAYLHFEAQTDHGYKFTCDQCGSNPAIVILDANRKTCFGLKGSTIKEPPDEVDMFQFWNQIDSHVVAGTRCKKGIINPYARDIQYEGWSQWMAPSSISSIINTEFKKLKKVHEPIDIDELDKKLSDEYLDSLLCEASVGFVKDVAKEVGISDKGSKMDVIVRLQDITKSNFKKIFSKLWGRSGGFLAMLCHHGICYGVKPIIRAESVRDHIDMILSMKHQPTVIINDVSNMTFRHGQKRRPGMFSPYEGRVAGATEENISLAKEGKLSIDMEFLNDLSQGKDSHLPDTHPVTNTDNHVGR